MTIKRIVTANEASKPPAIDVASAIEELQKKSAQDIEVETAYKWASRSIGAYQLYKKAQAAKKPDAALKYLTDSDNYRHEALEHASLAEDGFKTLNAVDKEMSKERGKKN